MSEQKDSDLRPEKKQSDPESLLEYAIAVLTTSSSDEKARLTCQAMHRWKKGTLPIHMGDVASVPTPPDHPARPTQLETIDPRNMPQRAKLKGIENRLLLLHSLCHIESYAMDLSWDILVRFANTRLSAGSATSTSSNPNHAEQPLPVVAAAATSSPEGPGGGGAGGVASPFGLPVDFFGDWLRVAYEECVHFKIWKLRLKELESHYGAYPVHDGLWESATDTNSSLLARLAVVHMVHEARGLDVAPKRFAQLSSAGDKRSAQFLERIEKDEVTHVTAGMKWFKYVCQHLETPEDPISCFHKLVKENFRGSLRPPFAKEAREVAGFTEEWYMPLVDPKFLSSAQNSKKHKSKGKNKKSNQNSKAVELDLEMLIAGS